MLHVTHAASRPAPPRHRQRQHRIPASRVPATATRARPAPALNRPRL